MDIEGKTYFFLSREEFQQHREQNDFLEWAEVYGNFYGTLRSEVERLQREGKNVILEIDTQGAMQVEAACPGSVSVFILPPSLDVLRQRITGRGTESPGRAGSSSITSGGRDGAVCFLRLSNR